MAKKWSAITRIINKSAAPNGYVPAYDPDGVTDADKNPLINLSSFTNATLAPSSQLFSGTGAQTNFTLAQAINSEEEILVSVAGVVQRPTTDYTVSGTTLAFVSPPASATNNIEVRTTIGGGFQNYSTTEQVIGEWLGSTLYRKVVDCGVMPNNNTKTVPHGITGLDITGLVKLTGIMNDGSAIGWEIGDGTTNTLFTSSLLINGANISLTSVSDRSGYTAKAIIEYTKT